MESSKQFFCHTCKVDFAAVVFENEDVTCPICKEVFVELIEDVPQLQTLKELYHGEQPNNAASANQNRGNRTHSHDSEEFFDCNSGDNLSSNKKIDVKNEEEKKEEPVQQEQYQQQQNNPQVHSQTFTSSNGAARVTAQVHNINLNAQNGQWMNNITDQINNLMRNQGQTTTVNHNGQNINVSTMQSQNGDTSIAIANIEPEGLHEGEDDEWEDVDDEGNPIPVQVQQMDIDIDLEQLIGGAGINPNPADGANNQQQVPPQLNFQNLFGNLGNIFGGGGVNIGNGAGGQQVFSQVYNILTGPNGQPNFFNGGQFTNLIDQFDQNLLNQVMEQSIQSAQNANQGIPTSKSFVEKLQVIKGTDLMQKKDCQVCFEFFIDEDRMLKLPCKHLFHKDCILPWLDKHNTCPSCRHQLPTDDIEHENRRSQGNQQNPIQQFLNGLNPNNGNDGDNNSNPGESTFNSSYHS